MPDPVRCPAFEGAISRVAETWTLRPAGSKAHLIRSRYDLQRRYGNRGPPRQWDHLSSPRPTRIGRLKRILTANPCIYRFYTEGSTTEHHCHPESNGKLTFQNPSSPSSDSLSSTSRRVGELAGRFGAPGAGCDSPLALINETLRFVAEKLNGLPEGMWRANNGGEGAFRFGEEELKKMEGERTEGLDFVVWTGDSARWVDAL